MEIFGFFVFILFLFVIILIGGTWLSGEDSNVSECYMKFKELGCSMIRPSEECKTYLECLQKYEMKKDESFIEGWGTYKGLFLGFTGYLVKKFVEKKILA